MKGEPFHFNQANQMKLAQFATGMNGDEDLGEDIQMKGEPFHFAQQQWNNAEGTLNYYKSSKRRNEKQIKFDGLRSTLFI